MPENKNLTPFDEPFEEEDSISTAHTIPLTPEQIEEQEKRALELLGLDKEWTELEDDEKSNLLKSSSRKRAYDTIDTTTHPRSKKIQQKKGEVAEILKKKLLSTEVLRKPTVYLGSGEDIEYSLALGCRNLIMVDPILDNESIQRIINKLKALGGQELSIQANTIEFDFDFGEGPEKSSIEIAQKVYNPPPEAPLVYEVFEIPEEAGLILGFASIGYMGLEDKIETKIAKGGAILSDQYFAQVNDGKLHSIELGKKV
jgi:hypothetical protein